MARAKNGKCQPQDKTRHQLLLWLVSVRSQILDLMDSVQSIQSEIDENPKGVIACLLANSCDLEDLYDKLGQADCASGNLYVRPSSALPDPLSDLPQPTGR